MQSRYRLDILCENCKWNYGRAAEKNVTKWFICFRSFARLNNGYQSKAIGRQTDRQKDRETERQKDRDTERQRDRKTERQKDRETERQRDREAERQRDRAVK